VQGVYADKDAAGRAAFIAKWVQRHQRRLAAGLPASVLVLAMGSAAAAQEGMTDLSTVDGVADVELRADGSVKVTLDNGSTVVLPQQSVSVGADGTILISASAMDSLTAIIAYAGVDVGVVGGGLAVAGLGLAMGGGSGGGAVTGGGGGGTGGGDTGGGGGGAVLSSNGRVIDGYIANATVFRDLNANGILDAGEPNVRTDATGNFAGLEGTGGVIVAFGGTDISTGKAFTGQLTAPSTATVVTPLTTLVQALVQQGNGAVTAEQAAQQVAQAFGLVDFDINNDDPVIAGEAGLAALKAGAQVAAIISVAAAGAAAGGEAAASDAVAQSLATAIANRSVEALGTPLTNAAITDALQAAAGDDADVTDKVTALNTAVQAIGSAQNVAGVEKAQTVVQGDLVDAVRNETTIPDAGTIEAAIEAAAPLRPTLDDGRLPEVINAQDAADFSVILSGNGRNGTSINIQFGDVTITDATTVAEGFWIYTLTELPSDGVEKLLVTATETVGDLSVTSLPANFQPTITIDTTIPATPTVALAEDTGSLAGVTSNGTITVSGLEDGTTREYALNGGGWTPFEGDSFLLAVEGDYSVTVRQTDAAGNISDLSDALEFTLDMTAPGTPTLLFFESGDVINADMAQEGVTVTGTVEQGATVTLVSGRTTFTVTDGEGDDSLDGSYSIILSADQLPDDGDYTISITATDGAGNVSAPFEIDITVDTTAPSAPTISLAEITGLVAGFTRSSEIAVFGLEDGARAEFSNNGGEWFPINGDRFTLPLGWGDGVYDIAVRQIDEAGNVSPASDTLSFTLDTAAPSAPMIAAVSSDDTIGIDEATFEVTGTAEDGAFISVTFNGVTQDLTASGGTFSVRFATPDASDTYTISATATDRAGNISEAATRPITVDLTPEEEPSGAMALIGSAMTLAEMEAALTAFAAEQELTIPDGMLSDLAGDALIYRSGQYSLTFSATVFANDEGDEIANNTTLSGTFKFELPLADFIDHTAGAPNPEAVFQYEQSGIASSSFSGFTIENLRLGQPSLRMDVEPFAVGPEDDDYDFILALIGQQALDDLNEAGTITSLQIWLSNVVAPGQDEETGNFFGLNGTEVSINLFRAGSVGLDSFFDDLAANTLRQLQIVRFENGSDDTLATARINTLDVTFTPGNGYVAADLVDGFNALIALRTAIDTAVEKANAGQLTVADVLAVANALESEALPFAPPFLAGEALSQADVNRLFEFRNSTSVEQQAAVDETNASGAVFDNLTDLVASRGDETTLGFVRNEFGFDYSKIFINGEEVDLAAIIKDLIGDPGARLFVELNPADGAPGIVLANGNVAVSVLAEGNIAEDVGEDWLLILSPTGEVVSYFNAVDDGSGFLVPVDTLGEFNGVAFAVINAAFTDQGFVQNSDPYATIYQLSAGDIADLPVGEITREILIQNSEVLKTIDAAGIGAIGEGLGFLPDIVGVDPTRRRGGPLGCRCACRAIQRSCDGAACRLSRAWRAGGRRPARPLVLVGASGASLELFASDPCCDAGQFFGAGHVDFHHGCL
jgi:hypothetical protein